MDVPIEHEESNIYSAHVCYQVGDVYYGATLPQKIGHSNPNKYGSWWRGPYLVSVVSKLPIVNGFEIYNEKICNTRHVVLRILEYDFSDTVGKRWLVKWFVNDTPHTCDTEECGTYSPVRCNSPAQCIPPKRPATVLGVQTSTQRREPERFAVPVEPKDFTTGTELPKQKRGRPPKIRYW